MLLLGLKQAGWRLRGSSEHLSYLKGAPQFCTSCFLFKETKNADSLLLDSKWKKCVVPLPKLTHRGWTWSTGRCYSSQDGLWGLGKTSFFRKNYFMILIIFMILYSFLNFIHLFMYLFLAVLGHYCCMQAFSSCGAGYSLLWCVGFSLG